jgi:hypothetical protein
LGKAGRVETLDFFLAHPRRRLTINELARTAKLPVATAWRAVQDLSDLGLVLVDRIGNAAIVRLNEGSPATRALQALEVPDPQTMAFESFREHVRRSVPRVTVSLFGSVDRGDAKPSSDVDAHVVYGHSGHSKRTVEDACASACVKVLDEYRIVVSPLITSRPVVIV